MEFGCYSKIQSLKSPVAKPLEAQIKINISSNIYNYIILSPTAKRSNRPSSLWI